jgi:hypothetical protein
VCQPLAFYGIRYLHYSYFLDFLSRLLRAGERLPRATKNRYGLLGEKEMRLFIHGSYAVASDRVVFPVAVNNNPFIFVFVF